LLDESSVKEIYPAGRRGSVENKADRWKPSSAIPPSHTTGCDSFYTITYSITVAPFSHFLIRFKPRRGNQILCVAWPARSRSLRQAFAKIGSRAG
jgi:hypothetical protein